MKAIFLLGGFIGFTASAVNGWSVGRAPDHLLLDALVSAVVVALLTAWFWRRVIGAIQLERRARIAGAAAAFAAARPTAPGGGRRE
jgi:hypothetical protein